MRVSPQVAELYAQSRGLFTVMQACRATDASYRQADYWCRLGLVETVDGEPSPGSGYARFVDHREVEVMASLVAWYRVAPATGGVVARLIADHVRREGLAGTVSHGPVTIDLERVRPPDFTAVVTSMSADV